MDETEGGKEDRRKEHQGAVKDTDVELSENAAHCPVHDRWMDWSA